MIGATIEKAGVIGEEGTIRIPVRVRGVLVDGTDGLAGVREITLTWDDGVPQSGNEAFALSDAAALCGKVFGCERYGLPCWLMGDRDRPHEDPESGDHHDCCDDDDARLWQRGTSRAWVVVAMRTGQTNLILHRREDAEWLAKQLCEAVPDAFAAADVMIRAAAHKWGVSEWAHTAAFLLNHGIPRDMVAGCRAYIGDHGHE